MDMILFGKNRPNLVETLYILINCDLGSEVDIINEFMKIPEVKEVRGTYGVYDIFVKLQGDTREALENIITHKIRRIPKIRSTVTLSPIMAQGGR
jgi:DNA-binding Lrp family transcriptional regulator